MKKIFAFSIIVLIFSSPSFGQKIYETQLPVDVLDAFKSKFPSAKEAKWVKEDTIYSAEFLMDNAPTKAEFDLIGIWLNTEWKIQLKYTPQSIKGYIDTAYSGYKITKLNIEDYPESDKLYVAEIKKKNELLEVYFSINGAFDKAVKKSCNSKKKK